MTRNNHAWIKGDLTGDIYYDTFTLGNKATQYLRLCMMVKGVQGSSAVKGLRICVYGPRAEMAYGYVRKGSRIAVIGHIQQRKTKSGKLVFEIVAEEIEYLRNIDWETGDRVRDDLIARGELRASYQDEDAGSGSPGLPDMGPEEAFDAVFA
ncbi:MAG: single-stranded DNA-binding protein [Chloroflexota bacterium]